MRFRRPGDVLRVRGEGCRQVGEGADVRSDHQATPVDATVVQVRPILELPAGEVAGCREPCNVRPFRGTVVTLFYDLLCGDGELGDSSVPLLDRIARLDSILVEVGAVVALVGGGVCITPREHGVRDDDVAGVLASRARRSCDDESAVPIAW